jgi:HK97 gp10 family phage protein
MARASWKGLPQLKAKLIRLKEQTAERIRPAMEKAAQDVVDMMKRQVPVEHGDLRDSIGWTWGSAPKGSIKVASASGITIFAGNDKAFYARFIEFGTAPHIQGGQFAGTEHPGTPAQPFFFPSWRASKKAILAALRKAIGEAVRSLVR